MAYKTQVVQIGTLKIGGGNPVVVQSMTNTDTRDSLDTLRQIQALAHAGCELVRVAVPDTIAAKALSEIVQQSPLPLVADIHFDYKLAIMALDAGIPALRINPGNILKSLPSGEFNTKPLDVLSQKIIAHDAVVRIGVNAGSLERDLLAKYGKPTSEAMVESAMRHVQLLEERGVRQIKISLKSSNVKESIAAYTLMSQKTNYPLHLGITEAGTYMRGAVKSAIGLGSLLLSGIGDTIRVSLTADPVEEIAVAYEILRASDVRHVGVEIISCPTCGRTEIDLMDIVDKVEKSVYGIRKNIKVAVMGCVVNGPGEAREADIGLAGGRDKGVIFRKGKVIRSVEGNENLIKIFLKELENLLSES